MTATLVTHVLGVSPEVVRPLPLDTEVDVCGIRVVAVDANHCPGAVMLVFHTPAGVALFTGDFRYTPEMRRHPLLRELAAQPTLCGVDRLFLDNTFGQPKAAFPPQAEVIQYVVDRCVAVAAEARRCLFLVGTYTIGKERVFTAVGRALACPVHVDAEKFQTLQHCGFDMGAFRLTADWRPGRDPCCVVALPMLALSFKRVAAYLQTGRLPFLGGQPIDHFDAIVAFCPTGWSTGASGAYSKRQQGPFEVHSVPYSEHSSFRELLDFVEFLRPKSIVPTVDAKAFQATREAFLRLCRQPPPSVIQRLGGYATKDEKSPVANTERFPFGEKETPPASDSLDSSSLLYDESSCVFFDEGEDSQQSMSVRQLSINSAPDPSAPGPTLPPGGGLVAPWPAGGGLGGPRASSLLPPPLPSDGRPPGDAPSPWDTWPHPSSVPDSSQPPIAPDATAAPSRETGPEALGAYRPRSAVRMPVTFGQSMATLRAALGGPALAAAPTPAEEAALPPTPGGASPPPSVTAAGDPPHPKPGVGAVGPDGGGEGATLDLEDPDPVFVAQQRWILRDIQNERRGLQRSLSAPSAPTGIPHSRVANGSPAAVKRCQTNPSPGSAAKKPRYTCPGPPQRPAVQSTMWQAFLPRGPPPPP
eukprot:EG_transcript_5142